MQGTIGTLGRTGSAVAVEFTLHHSDPVTVSLYDMAGKEIASHVKQHLDAGSYKYSRDTYAFSQGCYAIRLQAGATGRTKIIRIMH